MLKYYCANIALLENKPVFDEWFERMHVQRKEKILRCKQEDDKKRSLMAGILLKHALEVEGLCYEALEFCKTEKGKPILCNHPELHFSLSHSNEYAGCLISDVQVGVDIEYKERASLLKDDGKHLLQLAEKTLSAEEMNQFLLCEEEKRGRKYLEYWTKKESFSKAVGNGIQMDFSNIDTEINAKDFWSIWTNDGYCVSIYSENKNYQELKIEKLRSLM